MLDNVGQKYQHIYEDLQHSIEKNLWQSSLLLRQKFLGAKLESHQGAHPLTYLKFGLEEGPVLIFLHGFADEKHNFFLSGKFLSSKFQIIVPDIPGFGDSKKYLDRTYMLDTYALWIDDLVQSLGIKEFHLMGNSLGGGIAIKYTLLYPQKVQSLVIVDSAGVHPEKSRSLYCEFLEGKNLFLLNHPQDFEAFLKRVFYKRPYIPSFLFNFIARDFHNNRDWYAKLTRDLLHGPHAFSEKIPNWQERIDLGLNPHLKKIDIPTFILWGKEDSLFPTEIAHILKREIAQSELKIYNEVGHSPQAEIPWRFVQDLLRFYRPLLKSKV